MKINIRQNDLTDCGPACLASVASHYGLKLPLTGIRQWAETDCRGTNLLGMIKAANEIGFEAKAVRVQTADLPMVPLPAIAHVIIREKVQHFVVIYRVTSRFVRFMDPGPGKTRRINHIEWNKMSTGIFLLLSPAKHFQPGNRKISSYRRLWDLARPHRRSLYLALAGAMAYTLLGLSTSIFIQKITDVVLVDKNHRLLNLLGIIMILLLLFQTFIGAYKSVLVVRSGQRIDAGLISGYYRHLLQLPIRFFETMREGEILSRIGDAVKIRTFINEAAVNLFVNIFIILFSFILMFSYYWKLALVASLILPAYVVLYVVTNVLNRNRERKMMEHAAELEAQLVESLRSVRTIKQLGLEQHSRIQVEQKLVNVLDSSYRSEMNGLLTNSGTELISRLFTIAMLWGGAFLVIDRIITPGELLSCYALMAYFTGPAASVIAMNKVLQNAFIATDRLFELVDLAPEENATTMDLTPEMIGNITLENVEFSYGTREEVLRDLSMSIPAGSFSVIVGGNGSGKSTVAALIQKFHPVNRGRIRIGRYDLSQLSSKSVREAIGVVPQQVQLFAGSLAYNIALDEREPDFRRIVDICRNLGLRALIESLPRGLDTDLGENGVLLSGGQRQRLALARALYRNPQILILDEATSSLDTATESLVIRELDRFCSQGKTILAIAHRLAICKRADRIFVLDQGQLVEEGVHQSLLQLNGQYADLWKKQFIIHPPCYVPGIQS